MNEETWIKDMRRRIQWALNESNRDRLRSEHGMLPGFTDPDIVSEDENEWLDYITEFERQFENPVRISVRERIGNPQIVPLSELPDEFVEEAFEILLELLAAHNIAVDFFGDFEPDVAYRRLTEELLDEEMDDIRIEGLVSHFAFSTPECDVEMWVSDFVLSLFMHEPYFFIQNLDKQPHFNLEGQPVAADDIRNKIIAIWDRYPENGTYMIEPTIISVEGENGLVHADVSWQKDESSVPITMKSIFRLQPSPYTGWDIVYTSLLDDLLSQPRGRILRGYDQ